MNDETAPSPMHRPQNVCDCFSCCNFKALLEKERNHYLRIARWHYRLLRYFYFGAILFSFTATVLQTTGLFPAWTIAAMAGMPGVLVVACITLKFDERARWHYIKYRRIESFRYELCFEHKTVSEVSEKLRNMHAEMESSWPGVKPIQ